MTRLPSSPATVRATLSAIAFAAGVSWGVAGGDWRGVALAVAVCGTGLALIAVACRPRWRRRLVLIACVIAFAAMGALRGFASGPAAALAANRDGARGPVVIDGTVRDAPTRHHRESLLVIDIDSLTDSAGSTRPHIAVVAAVQGAVDAFPGDHVRVVATDLRPPSTRPGPESAAALDREGVAAVAVSPRVTVTARGGASPSRWLAQVRARLSAASAEVLAEPTATLVDEFALGVRGTLPTDVSAPLQDAGLIHLVATSGLKVALLIGLMLRLLTAAALPPKARLVTVVSVTAAYVALTGGGPAAVRAAIMALVALAAAPSGRRSQPLALLSVVGAAMLAGSPRLCLNVGFQLSFLGTAGIMLFADPICRRVRGPRLIVEPFAVTVAAQLATFPVMASTFGVISIVGPLANALAVPLLPLLLVLGWSGALLAQLHPLLGWLPLQLAGLVAGLIVDIARVAAVVPFAAIHVGVWPHSWIAAEAIGLIGAAAAAAAVRRWWRRSSPPLGDGRPSTARVPRHHRMAMAFAVTLSASVAGGSVLVAAARPDGRLHVSVLAVGAAPAVLVTTPDGALVLVDGGSDPTRLAQSVGSVLAPTVRTIDVLAVTGGERAAIAGLEGLRPHYSVRHVISPPIALSTGAAAQLNALRDAGADVTTTGSPWSWGGVEWRFVCASPGETSQGSAIPSCAVQLATRTGSALLLGDVAVAQQEELAGLFGDTMQADLVVAPPGGALAPALLDAARPHHVAVPSARALRRSSAIGGVVPRSTGADGTLDYSGGPSGLAP